jgi:hypothetical protein
MTGGKYCFTIEARNRKFKKEGCVIAHAVIPAKAGIQRLSMLLSDNGFPLSRERQKGSLKRYSIGIFPVYSVVGFDKMIIRVRRLK